MGGNRCAANASEPRLTSEVEMMYNRGIEPTKKRKECKDEPGRNVRWSQGEGICIPRDKIRTC